MNFGLDRASFDYLAKVWRGVQAPSQNTVPVNISTTSTFYYNPQIHGQKCTVYVSGTITVTIDVVPNSLIPGAEYSLRFIALDTGTRTFAYNSTVYKTPSGTLQITTGTATLNAIDRLNIDALTSSTGVLYQSYASAQ